MTTQGKDGPPIYRVTWAFVGALVGGVVVWALSTRELRVVPIGVSYGDLAAIALTAVTVILAVFGLIAALAALYGYRAFMKVSAATAANVAKAEAVEQIKLYMTETAEPVLVEQAERVALRVITPQALQELIREQVNAMTLGDQRDVDLDQAEARMVDADTLDDLDHDEDQTEE